MAELQDGLKNIDPNDEGGKAIYNHLKRIMEDPKGDPRIKKAASLVAIQQKHSDLVYKYLESLGDNTAGAEFWGLCRSMPKNSATKCPITSVVFRCMKG